MIEKNIEELEKEIDDLKTKLDGYYQSYDNLLSNMEIVNSLYRELMEEYREAKKERKELEEKLNNLINQQLEPSDEKSIVNEIVKRNKLINEIRQYLKSKMYKERSLLQNIIELTEHIIQLPKELQNIINLKDKIEVEKEKVRLSGSQEDEGISISGLSYQDLIDLSKKIIKGVDSDAED